MGVLFKLIARFALLVGAMFAMTILAVVEPEAANSVATVILIVAGIAVFRPLRVFGLSNRVFSFLVAVFVGGFGMLMAQSISDTRGSASSMRLTAGNLPQKPQEQTFASKPTPPAPTTADQNNDRQAKLVLSEPRKPFVAVEPAPEPTFRRRVMFVNASELNVREGPAKNFKRAWSLYRNEKVLVIGQEGDWLKIQNGAYEGWVFGKYLVTNKLQPRQPKKQQLSVAAIKKILIKQSIALYRGSCPCPYNLKSNGYRCGRTSAYSRPGGASPLCYPGDVTDQMVARYRGLQN